MDDAVDQRHHAGGVREHLGLLGERTIHGEQQALGFVATANDLEEQVGVSITVGEVADLVDFG